MIPPEKVEEAVDVLRMLPPVIVTPLVERILEALSPWKVEEAVVEVALITGKLRTE